MTNKYQKMNILIAIIMTLILIITAIPAIAAPTSSANQYGKEPLQQTLTTLSFTAEADSYVEELHPDNNNGTLDYLHVENANNRSTESYLRFTVNGMLGTIQSAQLRVYTTANSSTNGPAVYATSNAWTETDIIWNNRPVPTSGAIDKGALDKNVWVEYDVTQLVAGNGTYSFVFVGDSSDAVKFSSREGTNPPELVITFNNSTSTVIPSVVPTSTQGGTLLTFTPTDDAYIRSDSPTANYGSGATLQADSSPIKNFLLKFNVTGINSQQVISAKLRLYDVDLSDKGGDFYRVDDNSWQEETVTWDTAPIANTSLLASVGSVSTSTWYEVDLTSLITGDGTYSLRVSSSSSTGNGADYSSKEGTHGPQLVITLLGTSIPTATSTPITNWTPTPTPTDTSSGSVVLVGAGDISTCSNNNDEATAKLLDGISGTVFAAGDNVYNSGTYSEYTNCYDPTWGRHKARTKPVPGNHEYNTSGASGYFQYFNNIPAYYAYNLGNWRIYALNSEVDVSASSAEVAWLQADLLANPKLCALAYWHKPRWSSGSTHGSNSAQQILWQVLYNAGVELVLNGHEHNYERFAEMNASGSATSPGLREIVVGTGGMSHYGFGTALSASQVRNSSTFGVLKLTLDSSSYSWQFVPVAGSTFTDSGTSNCH